MVSRWYTFNVILIKSAINNIPAILFGFIIAFIGSLIDLLFKITPFNSFLFFAIGILFLVIGYSIRVWATYYFYRAQMKVIVLKPQKHLITQGPFRYSRNPLYLGGNFFIFLGASLLLGTIFGILITFLHLPLINLMIKREEAQLEHQFGKQWVDYKNKVRRWI